MKNRSSADHMRRLSHLIWLNHSNQDPFLAISLDAKKAFDRVEWEFLFSTLTQFGFASTFINWIKILYKDPRAALMTNGIISSLFDLTRGTRVVYSPLYCLILFLSHWPLLSDPMQALEEWREGEKSTNYYYMRMTF